MKVNKTTIISKNQQDLYFDMHRAYASGPEPDSYTMHNIGDLTMVTLRVPCGDLPVDGPKAFDVVLQRCNNFYDKPEPAVGKALVLIIPFAGNYGHCLHDVIPKLLYYDENSDADVIYTRTSPLMQSLLDLFQIKFKKIIFVKEETQINPNTLQVEFHPTYHIRDKNKVKMLKSIIDKRALEMCKPKTKKSLIYCTRNSSTDTRHGRLMDVDNEKAIVKLLRSYARENNLQFVMFNGQEGGETMSHVKQMKIFNNAKIVVGPHGSAMANVIYCNPVNDIKVCEFTSGNDAQVQGKARFCKHYNFLNGFLLEELYDYYLVPFGIGSTPSVTTIDINNLKTFLTVI